MLNTNFESKWVKNIKSILSLIETGNTDLWEQHETIHSISIKNRIKQTLIDQNQQHWHSQLEHSNKGKSYAVFKVKICMEEYLTKLNKTNGPTCSLLKFRYGNHFFPIETGRWDDIEISECQCRLCHMPSEVADAFHYMLKCPQCSEDRQTLIKNTIIKDPACSNLNN